MRRLRWLLTAVSISLAGCSERAQSVSSLKLYPAKGKVLLADGKPLPAGKVLFVATKSGLRSAAPIESTGDFTFKGPSGDNALPEGEYRVAIEPAGTTADRKTKVSLPFASKYVDEDASDLKAVVTTDASKNDFPFKLEPKGQDEEGSSKATRLRSKRTRD